MTLERRYLAQVNAFMMDKKLDSCTVQAFYRLQIAHQIYFSVQYGRVRKCNSYTVSYTKDHITKCGFVQYYIFAQECTFAFVQVLRPLSTFREHFQVSTDCFENITCKLFPVALDQSYEVIPVADIVEKCMCIDVGSRMYVAVCSTLSRLAD